MRTANRLLRAACESNPLLTYIDLASPMLSPDLGRPRPEIFTADSLHMNEKGYEIWKAEVRRILLEREIRYEPVAPSVRLSD